MPAVPAFAEAKIRERHAGRRVLLVDDEPINLAISQHLLEDCGLLVDTASDGLEAIRRATDNDYALILMDMQMPNSTGCRRPKESAKPPRPCGHADPGDDRQRLCRRQGVLSRRRHGRFSRQADRPRTCSSPACSNGSSRVPPDNRRLSTSQRPRPIRAPPHSVTANKVECTPPIADNSSVCRPCSLCFRFARPP